MLVSVLLRGYEVTYTEKVPLTVCRLLSGVAVMVLLMLRAPRLLILLSSMLSILVSLMLAPRCC